MSATFKRPEPAPGGWNAPSWFGCQVGSTLWMLTGVFEFGRRSPWLGATFLGLFVAVNGFGLTLWMSRSRIGRIPAMIAMLVAIACTGLLALRLLELHLPIGPGDLVGPPRPIGSNRELRAGYLFLLIFPPCLIAFLVRNDRVARKRRRGSSSDLDTSTNTANSPDA